MPVDFDRDLTPAQRRAHYTARTNLTNVPSQAGSSWTAVQMGYMKDLVLKLASLVFDKYENNAVVTGDAKENTLDVDAVERHNFLMTFDPAYKIRFLHDTDELIADQIDNRAGIKALLNVYATVSDAHRIWVPGFTASQQWLLDRKAEYDAAVNPEPPGDPTVYMGANYQKPNDYGLTVTVVQ